MCEYNIPCVNIIIWHIFLFIETVVDSLPMTRISVLCTGRYQAGVCAMAGRVWAVGGCDGWNCLTSVETYDAQADSWSFNSPMITARRGCGVAFFKGMLSVILTHCRSSTSWPLALRLWTHRSLSCFVLFG